MKPVLFASLLADGGGSPPADNAPKLDPVALVLQASIPVKAVLILLVAFSLVCWLIIGVKALHLRRARRETERFLEAFDKAPGFDAVVQGLAAFRGSPLARIFAVGYDEMRRMTGGVMARLDDAQSTHVGAATRRAAQKDVQHLESWLGVLGTLGRIGRGSG